MEGNVNPQALQMGWSNENASLLSSTAAINVFVRARPCTSVKLLTDNQNTVSNSYLDQESATISIGAAGSSGNLHRFQFSGVLGPASDQPAVYSTLGLRQLLQIDLLEGVNCCVMAYGKAVIYPVVFYNF